MGDNNQNNNNQVQNPAGTGTATEQNQNPNTNTGGIDFGKFEEIIEKRLPGLMKSVLKSNGVEDDSDISGIISAYQNSKTQAQNAVNQELETLRKENEGYKARERQANIDSVVNATAKSLNIDTEKLAMMKYDLGDAVDKAGKVDADKLKTVLEDLATKAPWLKTENTSANNENNNNNNSGFKPGNNTKPATTAEERAALIKEVEKQLRI
jgi:hypothetical protein